MRMMWLAVLLTGVLTRAAPERSADPYVGHIVVDGVHGDVLLEDKADVVMYSASIVKLMDLLLICEMIQRGERSLDEMVRVTAEASLIGGSQVYLKEGETFTLGEMLNALVIKSANDVAVALAIHTAGSTGAFVMRMNERARQLNMSQTVFRSVHGLPPAKDQEPDVTTPRDLAILCREVVKYPLALKYTSETFRMFRNNSFELRTHNYLLGKVPGCDGLKTGFFSLAGFSIAATALRGDLRVIAIVGGSKSRQTRDRTATELIESGFIRLEALERERRDARERAEREAAERALREAAEQAERARARRARIGWTVAVVVLFIAGAAGVMALRQRIRRPRNGFEMDL